MFRGLHGPRHQWRSRQQHESTVHRRPPRGIDPKCIHLEDLARWCRLTSTELGSGIARIKTLRIARGRARHEKPHLEDYCVEPQEARTDDSPTWSRRIAHDDGLLGRITIERPDREAGRENPRPNGCKRMGFRKHGSETGAMV